MGAKNYDLTQGSMLSWGNGSHWLILYTSLLLPWGKLRNKNLHGACTSIAKASQHSAEFVWEDMYPIYQPSIMLEAHLFLVSQDRCGLWKNEKGVWLDPSIHKALANSHRFGQWFLFQQETLVCAFWITRTTKKSFRSFLLFGVNQERNLCQILVC